MEQFQLQGKAVRRAGGTRRQALTGVNASGNLEILVERVLADHECMVEVTTAVAGFRGTWDAVAQDFFTRASPGGLRFSINDGGARPDTVMLRLLQSVRLMEREP
ncbi:malonate decarboxylase acyl carrier protein [Neoroseomonas lacus]|uniref:Malonate decarboxylase acyl carrier protein n=1 Tax=Neoroseomonas lacus TaxID=287609 RepID=A0A917KA16_9PROT|nr:malonate decarboxylase acyl carrier protein [Neoroseomonas lacus]GGJ04846.1 malonate decarboxylase acyl carrier protein [Neoroseomonas lacus]